MKKIKDQINKLFLDSNSKEILQKSFNFLIFKGFGIVGGYAFTFFIAKNYGASMNGLVTLGFAVFLFSSAVTTFGIDVNLVKYYSDLNRWRSDPGLFFNVLLKTFLFSLTAVMILYLARDFVAIRLFKKPQFIPVYIWAIMAIPGWTMVAAVAGVLRAKGLNNWFAFFNNAGKFSFAVIILLLLESIHADPLNAIKAHFFAITALAFLGFFVVYKNFDRVTVKTQSKPWNFLKESFPMFISTTIIVFLGWIDSFVLGIYVSDDQIGVYNVAIKIALGTSFAMEAINSGLAPKVARLYYENQKAELKKLIQFSTRLNFAFTLVVVITIIILNQRLLGLFGEEFKSGNYVLLILCLVHLFNSFMGSGAIIMQMIGYQKQYQNIAISALVINLIFNFILIPKIGNIGAALATAFSLVFWFICNAVFLKRREGIITYLNPFIKK